MNATLWDVVKGVTIQYSDYKDSSQGRPHACFYTDGIGWENQCIADPE
jgi:hypothetical protein